MKNNEYTKLENNADESDNIPLKDLKEAAVSSNDDDAKLISESSSEDEVKSDEVSVAYTQNLKKDFNNICLLMFLYFLQGECLTSTFGVHLDLNLLEFFERHTNRPRRLVALHFELEKSFLRRSRYFFVCFVAILFEAVMG